MKLYRKTPKRIAKKWLRPFWHKLQNGLTLQPGDLVSTCKGYNERILRILPCWSYLNRRIVVDFDIETETGSSCSLCHCCTFPLETRKEIIEYWLNWDTPEGREDPRTVKIIEGIKAGLEVFDADGQPTFDFAAPYEQKIRFPAP